MKLLYKLIEFIENIIWLISIKFINIWYILKLKIKTLFAIFAISIIFLS